MLCAPPLYRARAARSSESGMLRNAVSKAMWVGRTTAAVIGLAIALAIVFGVATMALAAVPGDPFKLGKVNSINRLSTLVGTATSPMLRVQNKGTGTALDLRVQQGKPPLTTNSTGRVPRLNADMVDGKHASAFLPAAGKAADSDKLDGKSEEDFYAAGSKVADSDKLDGISSDELARSGRGFYSNLWSTVTFTSRTSATVNAPADGFVVVNGTVILNTSSSTCNPCHAHAHIFNTTNNQKSLDQLATIGNGTSSTHRDVMPMTWVFPVNAGDNTFELRTGVYPSNAPISFYNPTLTALYVPYGANGTSALASSSKLASPTGEEWEESSGGIMRKK